MCRMDLGHSYEYEELMEYGEYLKERYNQVLDVSDIGESHDRRRIPMFRIGNNPVQLIVTGGVHGRETINPVVLMKMIEDSCILEMDQRAMERWEKNKRREKSNNWKINTKFHDLILYQEYEEYELYRENSLVIIPLVNPDGYEISQKGFSVIRDLELREKIKDMGIDYRFWKYNGRGIDINRNFPCKMWRKKFDGDMPASENETIAVMSVMEQVRGEGYLDFHSRGKEIYYFRKTMSEKYNQKQKEWAKKIHDITKYDYVEPSREIEEEDTGGNTVHYYSEQIEKPAITIETVPEKAGFPLEIQWQRKTYKEIKDILDCKP